MQPAARATATSAPWIVNLAAVSIEISEDSEARLRNKRAGPRAAPLMKLGMEVSRGRRLAAAGSLAAAGLYWFRCFGGPPVVVVGVGAVVALSVVAIGRRSVLAQVLGRGPAWALFLTGLLFAWKMPHHALYAPMSVAAGAALLLSSPLLRTARARAEFAPARFRRTFLAGATSAVCVAAFAGLIGLVTAWYFTPHTFVWLASAAGLLGAAVGVVRMRAWGVLLGALTTIFVLVSAAVMRDWDPWLLQCAAPGALLALPVALAKLFPEQEAAAPAMRIEAAAPPALRVAGDAGAPVEESELAEPDLVGESSASASP